MTIWIICDCIIHINNSINENIISIYVNVFGTSSLKDLTFWSSSRFVRGSKCWVITENKILVDTVRIVWYEYDIVQYNRLVI